jgi:hypothetical protein
MHAHKPEPMSRDRGRRERLELEDLVHRARAELRDWTDHTDSDPGVALLELFAFVAELLSSHSDRIADEAYLGSDRHGSSRHAGGVEVEVDGHPWRRVADLAASSPQDRHYVVSRRGDGASVIEFGDGVHGRKPSAEHSIGVRYRDRGAYSSVLLQEGRVVLDTDWSDEPSGHTCGVHAAVVVDNADPLLRRSLLVRVPDLSGDTAVWAAACLPESGTTELPARGQGVWVAFESGDPSRPVWLGQRLTA